MLERQHHHFEVFEHPQNATIRMKMGAEIEKKEKRERRERDEGEEGRERTKRRNDNFELRLTSPLSMYCRICLVSVMTCFSSSDYPLDNAV